MKTNYSMVSPLSEERGRILKYLVIRVLDLQEAQEKDGEIATFWGATLVTIDRRLLPVTLMKGIDRTARQAIERGSPFDEIGALVERKIASSVNRFPEAVSVQNREAAAGLRGVRSVSGLGRDDRIR